MPGHLPATHMQISVGYYVQMIGRGLYSQSPVEGKSSVRYNLLRSFWPCFLSTWSLGFTEYPSSMFASCQPFPQLFLLQSELSKSLLSFQGLAFSCLVPAYGQSFFLSFPTVTQLPLALQFTTLMEVVNSDQNQSAMGILESLNPVKMPAQSLFSCT